MKTIDAVSRKGFRMKVLTAAAVGALALAGCGGSDEPEPENSPTIGSPVPSPDAETDDQDTPSDDDVELDEHATALIAAGRTAEEAVPGSRVIDVDWDDDNHWEIHVATEDGTESELEVSADGSEIRQGPRVDDDADDRAENAERLAGAQVDFEQAVKIVMAEVGSGRITDLDLDSSRGTVIWDAEVEDGRAEREVRVNAETGEIHSR